MELKLVLQIFLQVKYHASKRVKVLYFLVEDRSEEFGKDASLDLLLNCDSSISTSIIHENQQECEENALQAGTCVVMGLRKTALSSNVHPVNVHSCETEDSTGEHKGPRNELQAVKNPSPVPDEQTVPALDYELNSMDLEKENRPLTGDQSTSYNERGAGKSSPKCDNRKPLKDEVSNPRSLEATKVGTETRWFILSGHRLLRKEFEKVIKRLKGNVCTDSHQWSYQATHFIVPDPVRRTEKLFAAAASGRWILKSNYVMASNEAGRLLNEEKYEWHKKGLTEDLAIDLEAPRKWRLLRERTGHGAFYGMKIIIYGDCIVPPLDTLKRAVKAGDGTILATSPPYTRFLNSGVDFAVVDETMPCYDMWVREFLRCEIPCILADYLVAYVCKPGYPCDSYVQYNTHTWVKRSLKNLANRLEEVVDMVPSDDNNKMKC